MYQKIEAVNPGKHGNWSLKAGQNYSFASQLHAVPVVIQEFASLAMECPLVFTQDDVPRPLAVTGLVEGRNQMLDWDGRWAGHYVPAFLRRYPFTLAQTDDQARFALCLDPEFEGWNQDGLGERLFDSAGNSTAFSQSVLKFVQEFHSQTLRSEQFCRQLSDLGLFEPMSAQYRNRTGADPINVTGFSVISRNQLQALDPEVVQQLFASNELELIYLHLASLNRFASLGDSLTT